MKIINTTTGKVLAEITTNHGMTLDEALSLMRYSVKEDGEIWDDDNDKSLESDYEELDMIWD